MKHFVQVTKWCTGNVFGANLDVSTHDRTYEQNEVNSYETQWYRGCGDLSNISYQPWSDCPSGFLCYKRRFIARVIFTARRSSRKESRHFLKQKKQKKTYISLPIFILNNFLNLIHEFRRIARGLGTNKNYFRQFCQFWNEQSKKLERFYRKKSACKEFERSGSSRVKNFTKNWNNFIRNLLKIIWVSFYESPSL